MTLIAQMIQSVYLPITRCTADLYLRGQSIFFRANLIDTKLKYIYGNLTTREFSLRRNGEFKRRLLMGILLNGNSAGINLGKIIFPCILTKLLVPRCAINIRRAFPNRTRRNATARLIQSAKRAIKSAKIALLFIAYIIHPGDVI
ncbi:hypothetical protein DMN91_003534 [Ooceraea biroi]|uniref:Uncharacterized protein n=1 Tax=Ooceraea biroi TaxID=2015173 RepID=A0A3L8DSC4_OOCBI|nr:hypothetical protein DMN91_003534 [Ooceraea biroi]